jgi:hypothetical protein
MTDFRTLVTPLLMQRQPGHEGGYNFTIEAVFASAEVPELGEYAVLGVYRTKEEAEARQYYLANTFKHPFLSYRIKPMYSFDEFIKQRNTQVVHLSKDERWNDNLYKRIKEDNKMKEEYEKKQSIMETQKQNEDIEGTKENITRLVYLCSKYDKEIFNMEENRKEMEKHLSTRLNQLESSLKKEKEPWMEYAKEKLTIFNEEKTWEVMLNWWNNKRTITLSDSYSLEELKKMDQIFFALTTESMYNTEDNSLILSDLPKILQEFTNKDKTQRFLTGDKYISKYYDFLIKCKTYIDNIYKMFIEKREDMKEENFFNKITDYMKSLNKVIDDKKSILDKWNGKSNEEKEKTLEEEIALADEIDMDDFTVEKEELKVIIDNYVSLNSEVEKFIPLFKKIDELEEILLKKTNDEDVSFVLKSVKHEIFFTENRDKTFTEENFNNFIGSISFRNFSTGINDLSDIFSGKIEKRIYGPIQLIPYFKRFFSSSGSPEYDIKNLLMEKFNSLFNLNQFRDDMKVIENEMKNEMKDTNRDTEIEDKDVNKFLLEFQKDDVIVNELEELLEKEGIEEDEEGKEKIEDNCV